MDVLGRKRKDFKKRFEKLAKGWKNDGWLKCSKNEQNKETSPLIVSTKAFMTCLYSDEKNNKH